MSIPIGKIFNVAMKVLPHIGTAVSAVQILKGDAPGAEKKEAALEMVKVGVSQGEDAIGIDLFNDPEVVAAAGDLIDVSVKFAKIVNEARARRAAASTVAGPDPRD